MPTVANIWVGWQIAIGWDGLMWSVYICVCEHCFRSRFAENGRFGVILANKAANNLTPGLMPWTLGLVVSCHLGW